MVPVRPFRRIARIARIARVARVAGLAALVRALWHDATGDWDGAHRVAQDIETPEGAWVHAYLHRKEGDLVNAGYWYRRACKPVADGALAAEWRAILRALSATPVG